MVVLPRFDGGKDSPLSFVALVLFGILKGMTDPRDILSWHLLWEGKVVRDLVQLGKLEWPHFEGIWKVCVYGSSGENSD